MPESLSFDPVADRYDATRGYPAGVADRIAAGLMRLAGVVRGGNLLEIGIGTGRIALPLLAAGADVTGVDIAPLMVARLRAKYESQREEQPGRAWGALDVRLADMTALPFGAAAFDAVVGVHILHLVPEWRRALDEALRVIRPGGAFLLGQDVRDAAAIHAVGERWEELVVALGYTPRRPGAENYDAIVAELRRRGLDVREHTIATWEAEMTPRAALENVTERLWSQTWNVPDAIFAESVRRLRAWSSIRFGDTLDTVQISTYSFKVAVVRA